MLMIRLSRTGKPKQPYFRIIVSEKTKDPWGKYLEVVGNYNPRSKQLEANKDRIAYWLTKGAQLTNSLHNLLVKVGIIEGKTKRAYALTKKRLDKVNTVKAEAACAVAPKPAEAASEIQAPAEEKSTE